MRAPLAAQLEFPGAFGVEQHHRLDPHAAVLGAAEAQHIHPRAPGHVGGAGPGGDQRIGKTGAVHMHGQVVILCDRSQGLDLVRRINRPTFGHIGDRHRAALRAMYAACFLAVDHRAQGGGGRCIRLRGYAPGGCKTRSARGRPAWPETAHWRRCRWRPDRPRPRALRTGHESGRAPAWPDHRRHRASHSHHWRPPPVLSEAKNISGLPLSNGLPSPLRGHRIRGWSSPARCAPRGASARASRSAAGASRAAAGPRTGGDRHRKRA